jgi:hypothetical protein
MTSLYSPTQLQDRNTIIKSQILLENFLNTDIVNKLVHLFDDKYDNYLGRAHKLTTYIEDERKLRKLNNTNVSFVSYVYNYNKDNSTLYLGIQKNKKDFIHLTIHLVPKALNPKNSGIIHIVKNIYKNKTTKRTRPLTYALISVKQPPFKTKSLEFSIDYGYNTPGISNSHIYDHDIQKEMDVIITVLNRLFDEDNKEFYIGDNDNTIIYPIHNKTNLVLNNINKHTTIITRKNKGKFLLPTNISTDPSININYKSYYKPKNKKRGTIRKPLYPLKNKKRGITIRKVVK